jgi:transcriptional regulator GlxA family with amidase domain
MNYHKLREEELERLARRANFQPSIMAALWPLSLRQMERFFVREFRRTPAQWTRAFRCRLASELIAQGWSNKAVAAELGFGNASHLCHDFQRVFNTTPQSFGPRYGDQFPLQAGKRM